MTADLLIENFETLAGAPGGVPKLRELILSLAVRGKLVKQESGERCELLADIPAKDFPFSLPGNWSWCAFGSVTVNRDGERVPVSRDERARRRGPYDYYGASGVIDTIDGYLFDKPLLLIGEDGANLINRTTPIAFIARGKYWVNNHAHVVDAAPGLSLEYLSLFVNAISLESYITGTAQPKMNQAKMNSIPVAVPPLPEQHRIVAKVDELMALCDALEARQEEARKTQAALTRSALHHLTTATDPAEISNRWNFIAAHFQSLEARPENVAELRRAILQLAVMGKLVPQNTAEISQSVPLLHDDKQPFPIPENWGWTRLANIDDPDRGITYGVLVPGPEVDAGVPLIRVQDLHPSDPFASPTKRIAKSIADQYQRTVLKGDEVLVGVVGSIGRIGVVPEAWRGAVIARAVCRVVPSPLLYRGYLLTALQAPMAQEFFTSTTRTLAQPTLNVGQLESTPIPLPPLPEQHRIVAKVDELMKLCDELEAALTRERADADRLFDAVVAQLVEKAA